MNQRLRRLHWSALLANRGLQLLLLSSVTASSFFARTTLAPLQETIRFSLALNDNEMALLQGPPLAFGAIATIPIGLLIDRHSRVRLIWIFALLGLLGNGLTASASSLAVLFTARCLTGLSAAALFTTVLSLIADWFPPHQRGRATMAVAIGGAAGLSAAFAFGGFLLDTIGLRANSWRWAMLGLAVPLIVELLFVAALQEPSRSESVPKKPAPKEVYAALWQRRAILLPLTLGFGLVAGIADGAALTWATPALSRAFGLTPGQVGAIMASAFLVNGLLGPMLGGVLADLSQRIGGPYRTVSALSGLLFLSIPTGLFALAPGVASASVGLVVFLVAGSSFQIAVLALTTIVMSNELRASAITVMYGIASIFAFGVAPLLVSHLSVALGGESMIGKSLALICVASSLIGAVTFWLGRRPFRGLSVHNAKPHYLQQCTPSSSSK